ncbi:hypothetical protein [uncultured Zobellia sp.]|uniref:hypothetical protein n=1 Tax=uncultured Zobellia sp. TaxID=255433 RepID=UPI002594C525|nr:hypothetical protein [uncultured Zobellia sp.]
MCVAESKRKFAPVLFIAKPVANIMQNLPMNNFIFLILFFLISSCQSNHIFKYLENKEKVFIALDEYGLDSIPKEIGELKKAKELEIFNDSLEGWTIYPPLSAMNQRNYTPPFRTLPKELLYLDGLKKLTLHGLDIKTLPDDMEKLKELEYLDLSMNKLNMINEIPKLKKLPKLKYVEIFGNRINMLEIERWRNENPDIKISYGEE